MTNPTLYRLAAVGTDGKVGGPGGTPITDAVLSAVGEPANKVPVTNGSSGVNWDSLATIADGTPTPDTVDGDPGSTGTVADGGHSHPTSDLYDLKGQDDVHTVPASGGAVTLPASSSEQASVVTMTASPCHLTFPAAVQGARFTLFLQQDSTGGRVPSFPPNVGWPASGQPTWSTAAGEMDVVSFFCTDGVAWYPMGEPILGLVSPATALTLVQSMFVAGVGPAPTSLTFPGDVTPGSALIAFIDPIGSLTLSGGGVSWTQIEPSWEDPTSAAVEAQVWLGLDSTGGGGTATVSFGAAEAAGGVIFELSGVFLSSALDGSPVVSEYTSFPATTTPVTPSRNGDGVLHFIYAHGGQISTVDGTTVFMEPPGLYTTGSGYTLFNCHPTSSNGLTVALMTNSVSGQPYDVALAGPQGSPNQQTTLSLLLKNQS